MDKLNLGFKLMGDNNLVIFCCCGELFVLDKMLLLWEGVILLFLKLSCFDNYGLKRYFEGYYMISYLGM